MSSSTVFDLPISRSSAGIFNCYVVDTGTKLVVIDPGLPLVARRALDIIEQDLDRSVDDIAAINCTHAHPDHVAGVTTLTERVTCDIHLPHRCKSYLDGERPRTFPILESTLRFLPIWGGQQFSRHALAEFARHGKKVGYGGPPDITLDFEPAGFVDHGDPMPGADGWETIHAPGHTDDSTCFYNADTETLISGDAVITLEGCAWFNPEYVDTELAHSTEELLRSLKVRHLLPGHGDPIHAPDVWRAAQSFTTPPTGNGVLARCSRRFGKWIDAPGLI
jgi:glyoxylase-like metal-dependent hydrolase (beta-lactamase superfamily II)